MILEKNNKITVAMSGGVDSSVVAYILKEEGYEVLGMMLKIWDDLSKCCSLEDIADARNIAHKLKIPFYLKRFQDIFEKEIVNPFVDSYLKGETPIPCAFCNSKIKFPLIIKESKKLGANYIATGHYAKIEKRNNRFSVFKGDDTTKDQTYFLYQLTQEELKHIIFPIGELDKSAVREIAKNIGLGLEKKAESQEVCFVNDDYKKFIENRVKKSLLKSGKIILTNGKILGDHYGIHRYTIGQRKGLGVSYSQALYVVDIDAKNNNVIVGINDELFKEKASAYNLNWINKIPLQGQEVLVKLRYRQNSKKAIIEKIDSNNLTIKLLEKERAIAKGQAMVLYSYENELLGGGIIK